MASREFELKIGKGTAKFSIPAEHLLYELVGENIAPPEDLEEAYRHALAYPIDSPPLSEIVNPGETVVIAGSDITRVWQHNELLKSNSSIIVLKPHKRRIN